MVAFYCLSGLFVWIGLIAWCIHSCNASKEGMMNNLDRADFSNDLHHYVIDGHRMEEDKAIDYLIVQGMGLNGAYQYLKSLIQKLNAKVSTLFESYGIGAALILAPDEIFVMDNPAILSNADIDLLIGEPSPF
jgi:hypothetical protein